MIVDASPDEKKRLITSTEKNRRIRDITSVEFIEMVLCRIDRHAQVRTLYCFFLEGTFVPPLTHCLARGGVGSNE